MSLEPSPIWSGYQIKSAEEFERRLVPNFYWRPEIGSDVRDHFKMVRKLLKHAYYEYEFLDIAFSQALMGFEMALAKRYEEITGTDVKKSRLTLAGLLKWGKEQSMFEDNESSMDALRHLRNNMAHPRAKQLFGVTCLRSFPTIHDRINSLYDDPQKRIERKAELSRINNKLITFENNGAILEMDGVRTIVFVSRLILYDNRKYPPFYVFLFWNIFKPEYDSNNSIDEGNPIVIKTDSYKLDNDGLELSLNDKTIRVKSISGEVNSSRFAEFKSKYESQNMGSLSFFVETQIAEIQKGIWMQRNAQLAV